MTEDRRVELAERWPRQLAPSLLAALDEAGRRFRHEARAYRTPERAFGHKQHMDKNVRRAMAASFDDYARLIEEHAAALRTQGGNNDGR